MARKHHPTKADLRRASRRTARTRNRIILGGGLFLLLLLILVLIFKPGEKKETPVAEQGSTISLAEAYQEYQDGALLLDVREQDEWDDFRIPGTTLIPLSELEGRLDELPRDQRIVVVCNSGNRSDVGRDILLADGFADVTSMNGGVSGWRDAGYPIEDVTP